MLHHNSKTVAVYQWVNGQEADFLEPLRYAAARKLCIWHEHRAGGGSVYVTISEPDDDSEDSLALRFADHENTSPKHREPHFNFVNTTPTDEEVEDIDDRIPNARLCAKTAFAKHVGLTLPKLRNLLKPECYEGVCKNKEYPNTFTDYVVVATALQTLKAAGVVETFPVRQEYESWEDYSGY